MRILLTTDTIGGVWTFTRTLSEQLLQRGHAVALVSFGREPLPEQRAWCSRIHAMHRASFHHQASSAPLEWMENNGTAYEEGAKVLLDAARRFHPDLLHSSQYCFGNLPISIPKLITAHSDVLSWAEACRPGGLEPSAWLDRYRALVQMGLDNADAVAAPTYWMSDALHRNFHLDSTTDIVPNGRTLPHAEPQPNRILRAVSAGRFWDEAKGIRTLLQIDSPIPLLIAGEERFGMASAPANSAIQGLGKLAEEQLLALFRTSGIYIAASIYEPFGLAPLEAALCGCAILARDLPSFREVWGSAALYFDAAGCLERLLGFLSSDAIILYTAQQAAMNRARQFSAQRMAENYLSLYDDLFGASGSRRFRREELASNAA